MEGILSSSVLSEQKGSNLRMKPALADLSGAFSKTSDRERGLQRYQDLLKWREQRRKKVNVEKRHRKPSFKTGVFQPDQAKFLVSDDVQVMNSNVDTPAKPTPFKYLQRSSSKYGFTPGMSSKKIPRFCTGITPATSVSGMAKLSLRMTPNQSLGRVAILQRRTVSHKENLPNNNNISQKYDVKIRNHLKGKSAHGLGVKRLLRGRSAKRREALIDEDLGVAALPATPVMICPRRNRRSSVTPRISSEEAVEVKEIPSFAPENFAFNFNVTVRNTMQDDALVEKTTEVGVMRESCISKGKGYAQFEDESTSENEDATDVSNEAVQDEKEDLDQYDQVGHHELEASKVHIDFKQDVVQEVGGGDDIKQEREREIKSREEEMNIFKSDPNETECLEGVSVTGEGVEIEQNAGETFNDTMKLRNPTVTSKIRSGDISCDNNASHLVISGEELCNFSGLTKTPMSAQRKSTRRSTRRGTCLETTLTPMMLRLRPRTPCSRSTRRSLKAHTDFPVDVVFTPVTRGSTRKSLRRSTRRELRSNDELPMPIAFDECPSEGRFGPHSETPVEEEPKALGKESIIEEESEEETAMAALDNCMETPVEVRKYSTPQQDNMTTPSKSSGKSKVSWIVRESPYINTDKRSRSAKSSGVPADIKMLFEDIPTDGSPLPEHLTPLIDRYGGRDQGQSPVLAAPVVDIAPASGVFSSPGEDQTCSNLLELLKPSTPPMRNETPDVDVWGEESPEKPDDLISSLKATNTDAVVPSMVPLKVTTRRSHRISLLPGLSDSPMVVGKLSVVSEDLISWETPLLPSKKTSKMTKEKSVATPSRRSCRLSKPCPI